MVTKENINELISKFLSGEASPEEAMELEDWKEQAAENLAYFNSCRQIFDAAAGKSSPATDTGKAWKKVKVALEKEVPVIPLYPKKRFLELVAALVLLIGIGIACMYYFSGRAMEPLNYKTMAGQKTVKLPDASEVRIAAYSELNGDEGFGKTNRTLHLKGAAYFAVEHRDDLPFIVDAGDLFIKDIGTRFDIRMSKDTDTVFVRVDEGVVLLFDSAGTELTIKASEKAVYVKSIRKLVKNEEQIIPVLPTIQFTNTRLAEVVLELEKQYGVRIQIENGALYSCPITTQFNKEPIETVLAIITETLGISYEKTSSGYVIKGNKCNN